MLAPASTVSAPFTSVDAFSAALFDHTDPAAALDSQDYELLTRAVELVVQSQAFSRNGLRFALRLSAPAADEITALLEQLGVIADGEPNAAREVRVDAHDLPVMLAALRAYRRDHSA
jgi:DNA segregation ATPase FtsK/SpoIIIE-like protein